MGLLGTIELPVNWVLDGKLVATIALLCTCWVHRPQPSLPSFPLRFATMLFLLYPIVFSFTCLA